MIDFPRMSIKTWLLTTVDEDEDYDTNAEQNYNYARGKEKKNRGDTETCLTFNPSSLRGEFSEWDQPLPEDKLGKMEVWWDWLTNLSNCHVL